jgi:hypothetical protein
MFLVSVGNPFLTPAIQFMRYKKSSIIGDG